jgi:2-haloacid dehalogenase
MHTGRIGRDGVAITVTFDVFSALIDSRSGGSDFFGKLATRRSWECLPSEVYERWDARNKALHLQCRGWVPYVELARTALADTYQELVLSGDPREDCARLLASMADWPLWADVATAPPQIWSGLRVGLLTNIDDTQLNPTAAARWDIVNSELVNTSQTVQAYKPSREFYVRARSLLGPFVHVAASARDVRGALESGIPCVRLARPGHPLDPTGPVPAHTALSVAAVPTAVREAARLEY